jgi:hypothetical protein
LVCEEPDNRSFFRFNSFAGYRSRVLKIRKATVPEAIHGEIYTSLRIREVVLTPVKTWHPQDE